MLVVVLSVAMLDTYYMSNKTRQVKPLTEALIAEGKTVKCTKCHAWVGGKYRHSWSTTCFTCRGDGYITEQRRSEIRDFNAQKNHRNKVERELRKGLKTVLTHSPYRVELEGEISQMATVIMLDEGWDVPLPSSQQGDWAEWFVGRVEELTGWNFVEWFHSDEF